MNKKSILVSLFLVLIQCWLNAQSVVSVNTGNTQWWPAVACGDNNYSPANTVSGFYDALYTAHQTNTPTYTISFGTDITPRTIVLNGGRNEICRDDLIIEGPVDASGNPTVTLTGITNGYVLKITSASTNVVFRNLIIDAGSVNGSIGLLIDGASNITLENVFVKNAGASGVRAVNASNITLKNSSFFSNGKSQNVSSAYWAGLTQSTRNIDYAGALFENNTNVTVSGSNFYSNNGYGLLIRSSQTGNISNNKVGLDKAGDLAGNFGDGIALDGSSLFNIFENHVVANGNFSAFNGAGLQLNNNNFYGAGIELI